MVMFSVMISIPLLEYNTYFQDKSAYETGLEFLEKSGTYITPVYRFLE